MVVAHAHTTIVYSDAVAGCGMQIEAARQLFRSRAVDNRHTFRRRRSSVIMAKSMTDVALHDAAVNCATGVVWALLELRGLLTSKQLDSAHQDRVLHGGSTAQASASGVLSKKGAFVTRIQDRMPRGPGSLYRLAAWAADSASC